jgi:hypothetical protein
MPLEDPPIERTVSLKQAIMNVAFVLVALWLGFELASTDALRALEIPDALPTKTTPKQRVR